MKSLLLVARLVSRVDAAPSADLSGRWLLTYEQFGQQRFYVFQLAQSGAALTGDFDTDPMTGTITDGKIALAGKDEVGGTDHLTATIEAGVMKGTMELVFGADPTHPLKTAFTATRSAPRPAKPQRHVFDPTVFYRQFSGANKPVMSIAIGDTIATTTVDAGGFDAKGVQRSPGGNPQTGPFFVEGALPGDLLVVHLVKVRLNRDYAISDDGIVDRAQNGELAVRSNGLGKDIRWHLDRAKGVATSEAPGTHLQSYTVPLHPMLGCIATAVDANGAAPPTQDSGSFGGNMDFNELTEGATIYLPVRDPGALLYFGDGHAAQGDGELNGNALETSMDVEVSVDVIPHKRIPSPRIESATHMMATGYEGSLDAALSAATDNMARWLAATYKLTPSEVAQVLGTAAEYRVSEVADRNAGIVLKIAKDRLRTIK